MSLIGLASHSHFSFKGFSRVLVFRHFLFAMASLDGCLLLGHHYRHQTQEDFHRYHTLTPSRALLAAALDTQDRC